MKTVPLTRGEVAIVDDADYPLVSQFNWHCKAIRKTPLKYAIRNLPRSKEHGRRKQLLHQLLLVVPAGMTVDHIDCDGLNNQRSNLRIATKGQQRMNSRKRIVKISPYKGASPYKNGRWSARLRRHNRVICLGTFDSAKEAALAYDKAARRLLGVFARPNFGRVK